MYIIFFVVSKMLALRCHGADGAPVGHGISHELRHGLSGDGTMGYDGPRKRGNLRESTLYIFYG